MMRGIDRAGVELAVDQRELLQAQRLSNGLHQAVSDLRNWVTKHAKEGDFGSHYPYWEALYRLGLRMVEQVQPRFWGSRAEGDLCYLIMQDRAERRLLHAVARQPEALYRLSEQAVDAPDWEVRSELATAMGLCDASDTRFTELLITLACDPHAYVARCALLALAERGSSAAEVFAMKAWDSPNADQRVAAMHALAAVRSGRLPVILALAAADPHPYVRQAGLHLQALLVSKTTESGYD